MWELDYKESWALKNWCFSTVVLEKTHKGPLDCKEIKPVNPEGNQSWTFIGIHSLELQLQYFGHLMWRTDSLEKTLMQGKIEGRREGDDRGWDCWMASPTRWIRVLRKFLELVMDREAWHAEVNCVTNSQTWLSNWNELNCYELIKSQKHKEKSENCEWNLRELTIIKQNNIFRTKIPEGEKRENGQRSFLEHLIRT